MQFLHAVLQLVERFAMSPGHFALDPRVDDSRPARERILVPENRFPKWGNDAEAFIRALRDAQAKLGKAVSYREWKARKRG